jgi:hypothetical protein
MTSMSSQSRHAGQNVQYLPRQIPKHPVDYLFLVDLLKRYNSPRDKISRMIKNNEILQIKRGLYVLSPESGNPVNLKVLANMVYGPSYISLEYALSYYGLIPEKVEVVTCMTNKRNKVFETPVGIFSYKYLHNSKFSVGIDRVTVEDGSFLIATREKAICDRLSMVKDLRPGEIGEFLEYELRVDMDELVEMDIRQVGEIRTIYKNTSVTAFYRWLHQNK